MDLFLPLLSFFLILGGQGSQHSSFADAAKMTLINLETLPAYWEAALPGIPIPPAISDLFAQQKGLLQIGPNYERVKSEADPRDNHVHVISQLKADLKEAHRSHGEQGIRKVMMAHEPNIVKGDGGHHVHAHSYKNKKEADVFFFHDMLRPGSLITPTIPPTTSMPALLSRDVADSIPFSTEHLSDIITMFAPASLTMTREIRWTLDTCEHPRTLPGQKAGCATSLESLAELPASLLGRSNVRAFSAVDLPMDAPNTPALRGRYNVTSARKLSGSSSEVVTCHDLSYPYAVYYCHTSSPTAAYMVTLASVEEGASPAAMEVMAVCHLDTSSWSPKNPFFELHKVRPGDVSVCHFLTKLSIIWVTVDEHVDTL